MPLLMTRRVHVCHDPFMCAMTPSCVPWLIYWCYVCHDSIFDVTCAMTHLLMLLVPWLICWRYDSLIMHLCLCLCLRLRLCLFVWLSVFVPCLCLCVCLSVCLCVCASVCLCGFVSVRLCALTHSLKLRVCVCVSVCLSFCVSVCLCVCVSMCLCAMTHSLKLRLSGNAPAQDLHTTNESVTIIETTQIAPNKEAGRALRSVCCSVLQCVAVCCSVLQSEHSDLPQTIRSNPVKWHSTHNNSVHTTNTSVMTHMNESWHTWMSHRPPERIITHMKKSLPTWMSHGIPADNHVLCMLLFRCVCM